MNKKKLVSIVSGVIAIFMLLTLLLQVLPVGAVTSDKLEELEEQIKKLKEERQGMRDQIDGIRDQIDANMSEMEKLIAEKNAIDQEISLLNQQMLNINEQIVVYGMLIADKQDELDAAKDRLEQLREQNKERIRAMEEEGTLSYWSVLFKANSFADLLDRLNMIQEIAAADQRRLEEMNKAAEAVEQAQMELENEKKALEDTKAEVVLLQQELELKRVAADEVLAKLHAQGVEYEKLMEEAELAEQELLERLGQAEREYNEEHDRLEEEERKRREEEERKRREEEERKKREEEGSGGGSGGSGGGGGSGAQPSDAYWLVPCTYVYVSSPYGYRVHPISGTYTFHHGVDLASPSGTPIKASRAGVVTTATWDGAAGNYVSINHGDGFSSSYLHMTHYIVSPGQRVEQGQIIGYVGSTGASTGPHLHFAIYYNGASQNPAAYMNF